MNTENILKELGIDNLPEEEKQKVVEAMSISLMKRISVVVLEQLSEKDRDTFSKIREEGEPEEIDSFLRSKINNYDEVLNEVIKEFKEEMKSNIEKLNS